MPRRCGRRKPGNPPVPSRPSWLSAILRVSRTNWQGPPASKKPATGGLVGTSNGAAFFMLRQEKLGITLGLPIGRSLQMPGQSFSGSRDEDAAEQHLEKGDRRKADAQSAQQCADDRTDGHRRALNSSQARRARCQPRQWQECTERQSGGAEIATPVCGLRKEAAYALSVGAGSRPLPISCSMLSAMCS
jgi:hypothetical protein